MATASHLNSPPGQTFGVRTALDLLEKLRHETNYVWGGGVPTDARIRTYAVLNCAITAWQLKDWVFADLKQTGRLGRLHALAGRPITSSVAFGEWLCEHSRYLAACYQIATAAKHFTVTRNHDPRIRTDSEVRPAFARANETWTELLVFDGEDVAYVAEDLVMLICATWNRIFSDLGLFTHRDDVAS